MPQIAILSTDLISRENYLAGRGLPLNYMADFTLLGFVVDGYQDALSILASAGYRLTVQKGASEIHIDKATHLLQIKDLLLKNNIHCELTDIADTIYQA